MGQSHYKLFQTILALPDVLGVFCLNKDGTLIAHSSEEAHINEIFDEIRQRVVDFFDVVESDCRPTEEYFLRFSENSLYLRRRVQFTLGVFTTDQPNVMNLRAASNMLLKQMNFESISGATDKEPRNR